MATQSMNNLAGENICFVNARVITPYRVLSPGFVKVSGERIRDFGLGKPAAEGYRIVDLNGAYLSPGFIDLHLHGGGGYDTMDGTPEALLGIARFHASGGTTTLLPSTLSGSFLELYQVLDACKVAINEPNPGARILGMHLEGPYFAPSQAGAQDPRYLKHPEPCEYKALIESTNLIKRISAAPELPGGLEFGRYIQRKGIIAAIGHTEATFDDITEALEAGYTMMTHLYSGMSMMKRVNAYRVAGAVEAGLYFDELTVEVIADGKHLPSSLLKLIYKCKSADQMILCTDATRAAGLGEGEIWLGSKEDGQKVIVADGVAWMPDRKAFAGSIVNTIRLLQNIVQLAEVPLTEAVKMLTINPARILNAMDQFGVISPGHYADLVVFNSKFEVKLTMVAGTPVYITDDFVI